MCQKETAFATSKIYNLHANLKLQIRSNKVETDKSYDCLRKYNYNTVGHKINSVYMLNALLLEDKLKSLNISKIRNIL